MRGGSEPIKNINTIEKKKCGRKTISAIKNENVDTAPVSDNDIFDGLIRLNEHIVKMLAKLQNKVDKNKATETCERVKLNNRIKALEAFINDSFSK